jgi:hypothetical protein
MLFTLVSGKEELWNQGCIKHVRLSGYDSLELEPKHVKCGNNNIIKEHI